MKVNLTIQKGNNIRAFYLFFILFNIQVGVGVLGTPRYVIEHARQDAWLSILIAYIGLCAVLVVMFVILSRYENTDILGIQQDIFGKFFGKVFGGLYLLFLSLELLTILITYIEVIRIFLFPTLSAFMMASMLLILTIYSVSGGIRVVVGVVFIFTFLSFWIVPLAYDPISRIDWTHYFPMFDASITDLLKGAKATSYTFLGIEILFFIYPFIENKKKAKWPVYLGVTYTTSIVMLTTFISIGYFSLEGIHAIAWPTILLFKSVSFSFMERFDYFIVVEWMMNVLPTMILLMWAIGHGTKRLFRVNLKKTLLVVAAILLFLSVILKTDSQIQIITDFTGQVGFWIVYVYPIILLPIVLYKTRRKTPKDVSHEADS